MLPSGIGRAKITRPTISRKWAGLHAGRRKRSSRPPKSRQPLQTVNDDHGHKLEWVPASSCGRTSPASSCSLLITGAEVRGQCAFISATRRKADALFMQFVRVSARTAQITAGLMILTFVILFLHRAVCFKYLPHCLWCQMKPILGWIYFQGAKCPPRCVSRSSDHLFSLVKNDEFMSGVRLREHLFCHNGCMHVSNTMALL